MRILKGKKRKTKNTTVPKYNQNFRNRRNIDTSNTHLNDRSFSWIGTDTSIKPYKVVMCR
jgi:hypothetical protein